MVWYFVHNMHKVMMLVLILFMFVLVLLKLTFNRYFWTVIVEFFLQCNQYIVKVGLHSSLPMSCVFCLPGTIHTNWRFSKRIQQQWHLWMAIQESRCPCDWVRLAIRLCLYIGQVTDMHFHWVWEHFKTAWWGSWYKCCPVCKSTTGWWCPYALYIWLVRMLKYEEQSKKK